MISSRAPTRAPHCKRELKFNSVRALVITLLVFIALDSSARADVIKFNGVHFVVPDGWARNTMLEKAYRSLGYDGVVLYNRSTATNENMVGCHLRAEPLKIDKEVLYGYRFTLDDWKEILPNLSVASYLKLESSSGAKTVSGEPLFIGTFSYKAEPWLFHRMYVAYTGELMVSASCQGGAMTNLQDAREMVQKNLVAIHMIGKNLAP